MELISTENEETIAKYCHEDKNIGLKTHIRLSQKVAKLLLEISEQNKKRTEYTLNSQNVIDKSVNKIIFATAIIIVHELSHHKWANYKCSAIGGDPSLLDAEPFPTYDEFYDGQKEGEVGQVYEIECFGGIVDLGYEILDHESLKLINVILYYAPCCKSSSLELKSPYFDLNRSMKFSDCVNWKNNLIKSPLISKEVYKTYACQFESNASELKALSSKNKISLKTKVSLKSNDDYRSIVSIEFDLINNSDVELSINKSFDFSDFSIDVKDENGSDVHYLPIFRTKKCLNPQSFYSLKPGDCYKFNTVLHAVKNNKDLNHDGDYDDDSDEEFLKSVLNTKVILNQERQYDFLSGKKYIITSQYFCYNLSHECSNINTNLLEFKDFNFVETVLIPKRLSDLIEKYEETHGQFSK